MVYDGVGLIFERLVLPKKSAPPFHTRQRRKTTFITTKQAIDSQRELTMTVNNGRLRQAINNLLICGLT